MNKKLLTDTLIGIFFVSALGCLLHFCYQWSGENKLAALFCPVNESTWEHMKLLFFPMLIYAFYMAKKSDNPPDTFTDMLIGMLSGTFLIPILFYTYSGILGYNIMVLDISTFFVSVIAAFTISYQRISKKSANRYKNIWIGTTILLCILFFIFTFYPPDIALFASPV